jgi:hypothetical protein
MPREEREEAAAWLLGEPVAATVRLCRVARMAVASTTGPLVTAQLFSVAAGTVWMVTPRNSVKARILRRDPRAGLLLRAGRRSVVLQGRVDILDPLRPKGLAQLALSGGGLAIALARYAGRNTDMLAGYATDLLLSPRLDAVPYDRVLLGFRVDRGMLAAPAGIASTAGDWSGPPPPAAAVPPFTPRLPALPAAVAAGAAALLRDRQVACLGWMGPHGALALPATWDPASARAELLGDAVELSGAAEQGQGCIALDRSPAGRPTRFRGLLLRGPGRLEPLAGGSYGCSVAGERVTWWTGFETHTAPIGGTV